jgi:hypothetical protein
MEMTSCQAYVTAQSDITEAQSPQKSTYNIQPGDTSMQYNHVQTPNPEDTENISDDDWGRFGPEPNNQYSHSSKQPRRKLPELNLFKMVQQVRIPYTGRESSFAWYFKLRTAVQQYGVLLKPVDQFQRNKNLCPKTYYGEQITQDRYWDMSIALYQLLSHPETIAEDSDIQDIVTRHAVTADGYSCLYEIMERIHPVLNKNAKLDAPTYTPNCTSIHDYFNQFESYLLYNSLDHVCFTPRRQVQIFLAGLDHNFEPAIRYIRMLLWTWNEDEPSPPNELRISALPTSVEIVMAEENEGSAKIRTATGRLPYHTSNKSPKRKPHVPTAVRNYVDKQCAYCKRYGHIKLNCDKMAQYLICKEASQTLDDTLRKKIIHNYVKTLDLKQQKRLECFNGTIKQLYTTGEDEQARELIQHCLGNTGDTSSDDEDDDDDTSHTS